MKFHYISPYRRDKNIGKAINDAINDLKADMDDWIIHYDQDVLWLTPDTKGNLESLLETTDYGLLGCLTNRCNVKEQLWNGYMSKHASIQHHIAIAMMQWMDFRDITKRTEGDIAALMMCFRKRTWLEAGKFQENSLTFDKQFTRMCRANGVKIGILQGIYVFHLYRFTSEDPVHDTRHLKLTTN